MLPTTLFVGALPLHPWLCEAQDYCDYFTEMQFSPLNKETLTTNIARFPLLFLTSRLLLNLNL